MPLDGATVFAFALSMMITVGNASILFMRGILVIVKGRLPVFCFLFLLVQTFCPESYNRCSCH